MAAARLLTVCSKFFEPARAARLRLEGVDENDELDAEPKSDIDHVPEHTQRPMKESPADSNNRRTKKAAKVVDNDDDEYEEVGEVIDD